MAAFAATTTWYAREAGPLLSAVFGVAPPSQQRVPIGVSGPLTAWLGPILLVTAARGLAIVAGAAAKGLIRASIANDLMNSALSHVLRLHPDVRGETGVTELAERVVADAQEVAMFFEIGLGDALRNATVAIALAISAWSLDARLATFSVVVVPLGGLSVAALTRASREAERRAHRAGIRLQARVVEAATGARIFRAFGVLRYVEANVAKAVTEATHSEGQVAMLSRLVTPVIQLSVAIAGVAIIASGALGRAIDATSAASVISIGCSLGLLYRPLEGLLGTSYALAVGFAALERLEGTFALPAFADAERATDEPSAQPTELIVDAVHVAYGERVVLRAADLVARPGELIALVGASGVGKSTLLASIVGAVRPSAGSIRFGRSDLASLPDDERASIIGWVPQEPFLFEGTIEENVAFGAPIDRERVRRALMRASADTFVDAREAALASRVGEGDVPLSVGERQRICIARALYREPAVLVLDEPTASLDAATEARVVDALVELAESGAAVLVATHRASTFAKAHRVLELRDGLIFEARTDVARVARGGVA